MPIRGKKKKPVDALKLELDREREREREREHECGCMRSNFLVELELDGSIVVILLFCSSE